MIVLGVDGMDFRLLQRYLGEGRLPNCRRLSEQGGLKPLGTTVPPQSPVAWSTFITGEGPGRHGLFDFIHRDPSTLVPYNSMARVEEGKRQIALGSWVIPLESGKMTLRRKGKPFWQALSEAGIPATILRVPVNFPPVPSGARCLSGMGTPDILGTYGTYTIYSNGRIGEYAAAGEGGRFSPVQVRGGRIEAVLQGPKHPLRREHRGKERPFLEVGFTAWVDPESRAAKFQVQESVFVLREGEWSDWIPLRFDVVPYLRSVGGICKFYLKKCGSDFRLYVTPINIDPADPALPISEPEGFAAELARDLGRFYTQGMKEDTKALMHGVLSDEEYLVQARMVLEEQVRQFEYLLERFDGGLLFAYFSSIDQNSHMFWRAIDPKHPLYTPELAEAFGEVIPELYEEMDRVIGKAMEKIDPDTTLVVMSDHGFTSFRRTFFLNQWLVDEGYMAPSDPSGGEAGPLFMDVDWSRTQAYGLGLNGVYLNLREREPHGIVYRGAEANRVLDEISRKLLGLRDPADGAKVVQSCYRSSEVFDGDEMADAPDLLVGYSAGYRASWETVLGGLTGEGVLSDNLEKWSGDHCIDPGVVPGVLISNLPIIVDEPTLADMGPGILSYFGVSPPVGGEGGALFQEEGP